MTTQPNTANRHQEESWRAKFHLRNIALLEEFIETVHDVENADDLKRALNDAYENAFSRWSKLASTRETCEAAVRGDRAGEARSINAERAVRR